ncbi:N-formylglutamate deformylase [Rhodovibrio salinarum]|nr:N-formylglutamate deformylase [Rhodovibrio salinarum]
MVYKAVEGTGPLVVSMPHAGALTPEEVAERMTDAGRAAADTDWHVNRLYEFLDELEVPHIRSIYSRYVCDLNRPPDGSPLYDGQGASELVPTRTFDGAAIYQDDCEPGEDEIRSRWRDYWQPYHLALANLMLQAKDRYGVVVLLEAHTTRSQIPGLFDGTLPDFNLGTRDGASCAPDLRDRVVAAVQQAEGYSHAVDHPFKGGFITRSYGRPDEGTHALQLELAQRTYMQESPPWTYSNKGGGLVRPHLRRIVETMRDWAEAQAQG